MRKLVVLALTGLLCLTFTVQAQETSFILSDIDKTLVDYDQGIMGTVTDANLQPIEGAVAQVQDAEFIDTTDINGFYFIPMDTTGYFNVDFSTDGYLDISIENVFVDYGIATEQNVEMCAIEFDPDTEVMIWAGGSFNGCDWQDTILAFPGAWIEVPTYYLGVYDMVNLGGVNFSLGINNTYIDSFDYDGCYFGEITNEWDHRHFLNFNDDWQTDSLGNTWDSYSFYGLFCGPFPCLSPIIFVSGDAPVDFATFRIHIRDDLEMGDTIITNAINNGWDEQTGSGGVQDATGGISWTFSTHFAVLKFNSACQFLPGDVNMASGLWPATIRGSDVSYLVNYFRGTQPSCLLDGFYASADVNGDCMVIGADVTYLLHYFRGTPMSFCPYYHPTWLSTAEVPVEMPEGWPNCE